MPTHGPRSARPVAPAPRSTLDDFILVMVPAALVAFLVSFGHDEERAGIERMIVFFDRSIWNDVSPTSVLAVGAELVLIMIGLIVTVGAELELKVALDAARARKEAKRLRTERPCVPKPETTSAASKVGKKEVKQARVPATRPAEVHKKTSTPKVKEKPSPWTPPATEPARPAPQEAPDEAVEPPKPVREMPEPNHVPVEAHATAEAPCQEEPPETETRAEVPTLAAVQVPTTTDQPGRDAEETQKQKEQKRPAAATASRGLRRTVVLHKPSASSALGIVLVGDAPKPPHVVNLRPERIAAQTGGIKVGDRVLSVNGRAARGHAQTTRMLKERVGRVAIVVEAGEVAGSGDDGGAVLRATRAFAAAALAAHAPPPMQQQQQQQQQQIPVEAAPVEVEAAPVEAEAAPVEVEAAPVEAEAAPVEEAEEAVTAIRSSRLSIWLRRDDDSYGKGGGKPSDDNNLSDTDCDGSSGWDSSDACDSSAEARSDDSEADDDPEDARNDETFGAAEPWAAAGAVPSASAAGDIDWAKMSRLVDMLSAEGDAKRAAFAEGRKLLGGAWY